MGDSDADNEVWYFKNESHPEVVLHNLNNLRSVSINFIKNRKYLYPAFEFKIHNT